MCLSERPGWCRLKMQDPGEMSIGGHHANKNNQLKHKEPLKWKNQN